MSLSSASTTAEVIAAYIDNSGYEAGDGDAATFAKACRILLVKLPSMAAEDGNSISRDPKILQKELERALLVVATETESGKGGVVHYHARDLRT